MKSYSVEVLDELKKLEPIDSDVRDYILELLEYETSGGGHWKKEYLDIIEKIVKSKTKES